MNSSGHMLFGFKFPDWTCHALVTQHVPAIVCLVHQITPLPTRSMCAHRHPSLHAFDKRLIPTGHDGPALFAFDLYALIGEVLITPAQIDTIFEVGQSRRSKFTRGTVSTGRRGGLNTTVGYSPAQTGEALRHLQKRAHGTG